MKMNLYSLFSLWCAIGLVCRAEPPRARVDALIADLKDDEVRHNAGNAMVELMAMRPLPVQALEKALESDDFQQRQAAADILRSWSDAPPSRRLLEVTVEGLADDGFPNSRDGRHSTSELTVGEEGAPLPGLLLSVR